MITVHSCSVGRERSRVATHSDLRRVVDCTSATLYFTYYLESLKSVTPENIVRAYHQLLGIVYQQRQLLVMAYIKHEHVLPNIETLKTQATLAKT